MKSRDITYSSDTITYGSIRHLLRLQAHNWLTSTNVKIRTTQMLMGPLMQNGEGVGKSFGDNNLGVGRIPEKSYGAVSTAEIAEISEISKTRNSRKTFTACLVVRQGLVAYSAPYFSRLRSS
jgi:hypothetical protein